MVRDINGLELSKGDVVAPVSGDMKGKVCALKVEDDEGFVCIRAAHRPYSKGVWYAAEHVQRLAIGKVRPPRRASDSEAEAHAQPAAAAASEPAAAQQAPTSAGKPTRAGDGARTRTANAKPGRKAPPASRSASAKAARPGANGKTAKAAKGNGSAKTARSGSRSAAKSGASRAVASN